MREAVLVSHPVFEPGVCVRCNSQNRDWFLDLGVDKELNPHSPVGYYVEGAVYLCKECLTDLITGIYRQWDHFVSDKPENLKRRYKVPFNFENVPDAYFEEDEVSNEEAVLGEVHSTSRENLECGNYPELDNENDYDGPDTFDGHDSTSEGSDPEPESDDSDSESSDPDPEGDENKLASVWSGFSNS